MGDAVKITAKLPTELHAWGMQQPGGLAALIRRGLETLRDGGTPREEPPEDEAELLGYYRALPPLARTAALAFYRALGIKQ